MLSSFCLLLTVSATAGVGLRYDRDAREAGKGTFGLGSRGWLLTSERIWWEVFEVLTPEVDWIRMVYWALGYIGNWKTVPVCPVLSHFQA